MNRTPPPNRRHSARRPLRKQSLTGARRRDDCFGEPCRLWQLVAWYASSDGAPRGVYIVSPEWSIYVNRSDAPQPIEPRTKPNGERCMPGEAVAFRLTHDGRYVPAIRITRNAVLAIRAVPFVETLTPVLEAELRARGTAKTLVRDSHHGTAQ